ncbi:MAG: VWA domain-containing protein [Leptospiraceae bacterium]|nr:VWA domain-containing protein [Leptospiraceae bacterium]
MEWDQFVFYHLHKRYRRWKKFLTPKSPYFLYNFKSREKYLQRFLYLLSGASFQIQYTEENIRWVGDILYLPENINLLLDEKDSDLHIHFLLLYLAEKRKNFNSAQSIFIFNSIKRILQNYPKLKEPFRDWKKSLVELKQKDKSQFQRIIQLFHNSSIQIKEADKSKLTSKEGVGNLKKEERKEAKISKSLSEAEVIEEDKKQIEDYTLGHNFEKIETVEEFDGQWRDLDGSDEMEEQEEAVSELKLKHLIRTENPAHSTVTTESGLGFGGEIGDDKERVVTACYPEWNFKQKKYLSNHCTIHEENYLEYKSEYIEKLLSKNKKTSSHLKRKLHSLLNLKTIQRKKSSGEDIDLDAVVERYSDIVAKITPSEYIYTRKKREYSDIFIYFLMDISLSTDSWISGKRILDLEKEALLLFCDALDDISIPFALSAFYSRTRNHCKYLNIKQPKENWNQVKNKLGAIEPIGYTRIGPALRHTNHLLEEVPARQKWIILFTDARPNDYDRYEGKYGTEDVHKAIKELKQNGIHLHTLAIGKEEKPSIPEMMREASYNMLIHPDKLIDSLEKFFRKVI